MPIMKRNRILRSLAPEPLGWEDSVAVSEWVIVPGTDTGTLAAINPALNPAINPNGTSNAPWLDNQNIILPWCGAVWDEAAKTFWIPIGGGHSDYGGNESYKLLTNQSSCAWALHHEPSGSIQYPATEINPGNNTNYYSDGRLRSTHTYNLLTDIPGVGIFMADIVSPHPYDSGRGNQKAHIFNKTTGEWAQKAAVPSANFIGAGTCYDAARNRVWVLPNAREPLRYYSVAGDSWGSLGTDANALYYIGLTHMTDDDCVACLCYDADITANRFYIFDCDTGTRYAPTLTGSPVSGLEWSGKAQPHWVAELGCLCMWNNGTNTTKIATLTPSGDPRTDSWAWGELTVAGSNAVTPSARSGYGTGGDNGTYGRFQYSPGMHGFFLLNGKSEPTYYFKAW